MERVERIDFNGQPAWRKYYDFQPRRWRLAILRRLTRRLDIAPLNPPPVLPPLQAKKLKTSMIARLRQFGMRVPKILASNSDYLILSDLGISLAGACKVESDFERRMGLVNAGFAALSELHQRGGWLNQAFARNMTWSDNQVGFIDLDQDPTMTMSVPAAQARDLLLYMYSTARFASEQPIRYRQMFEHYLQQESTEVRAWIDRSIAALTWLVPLAPLCSRDMKAMIAIFEIIAPKSSSRWRWRFSAVVAAVSMAATLALLLALYI